MNWLIRLLQRVHEGHVFLLLKNKHLVSGPMERQTSSVAAIVFLYFFALAMLIVGIMVTVKGPIESNPLLAILILYGSYFLVYYSLIYPNLINREIYLEQSEEEIKNKIRTFYFVAICAFVSTFLSFGFVALLYFLFEPNRIK